MATFSASTTLSLSSIRPPHQTLRFSSAKLVSLRSEVSTLRMTSNLQICCAAKQETVQKVCEIVKKQLAVPDGTEVTPESTFADLGADSLDTVEIIMELETAFGITVEEDNAQSIATVQNAADLIEELVDSKPAADIIEESVDSKPAADLIEESVDSKPAAASKQTEQ